MSWAADGVQVAPCGWFSGLFPLVFRQDQQPLTFQGLLNACVALSPSFTILQAFGLWVYFMLSSRPRAL